MKIQEILIKNLNSEVDPLMVILKDKLNSIARSLIKEAGLPEQSLSFLVEHPKENDRGDYASNIAMALAGILKKNPLDIAKEIVTKISLDNYIEKSEAVAPAFINFKIKTNYFLEEIQNILEQKGDYGKFELKEAKKIMLEFGQPNTHKAFTVGHIKGAISGLALCGLIENLGYEVIKTNYYGDIGMHTAKSTWGVMVKGLPVNFDIWDKHRKMEFIAEAYVYATENFEANEEAIRQINIDIYAGTENEATELYEKIKTWSLEHQKALFSDLGIVYDKQYPESQVFAQAKEIINENKNTLFEESEGAIIYNGEKDNLNTWVVQTSENNPTYLAKDLALAYQKFEDYPDLALNLTVTGVEQVDHFKAVIKIIETLDNKFVDKYKHLSFGWLLMDGKKTSSRSGKNIKGTDILRESLEVAKKKIAEIKDYDKEKRDEIARVVSLAGIKFLILSHDFAKDVNYDPEKFVDFEGYSGPYVLYAYVRAQAILRKIEEETKDFSDLKNADLGEYELTLVKLLARYPAFAYRAGTDVSPHTMCNYLYEVAQRFNAFYSNCPVLDAESKDKQLRLALAQATAQVLKNGMGLLGIETVEEM